MAKDRLHLICGNCGCNDEWEWMYIQPEYCENDLINDCDVWLTCKNCLTIHSLSYYMERCQT